MYHLEVTVLDLFNKIVCVIPLLVKNTAAIRLSIDLDRLGERKVPAEIVNTNIRQF